MLALAASVVLLAMVDLPRPEHPRPDMLRSDWQSLNGQWDFTESDATVDDIAKLAFPDKISVPFCRESKLSGLGRKGFVKNVWYRREFTTPKWKDKRVLLHIGASDYLTTVYVNGQKVAWHQGGSTPMAMDITDYMAGDSNTLIVHAFDDTRSGIQPLGKQCDQLESYGCLYTRTTGIWQSVWLEGVGRSYIERLRIDAPMSGKVRIWPTIVGECDSVEFRVKDGDKVVATQKLSSDRFDKGVAIEIPKPKLWQPGNAFLYDLECSVTRNGSVVDKVLSYFGCRSVTVDGAAILINGKRIFQRLILDQGFYPDGIWTAPSDAALKKDIELSLAAGFNGARLHEKVFEPRFLYWADKLGYLVWGEFPNWGLDYKRPEVDDRFISEWKQVVARDYNHPSIVGWCPFNETGQDAVNLQNKVVAWTQEYDTSRVIIDSSGYTHGLPKPQVLDAHDYDQNPQSFKARWDRHLLNDDLPERYAKSASNGEPFMVSEYGGIGWDIGTGWGYGNMPKTLDEFFVRLKGLTDALLDNPQMFGFCYTQLTDVEQERNGIYTYDRKPKFDLSKIRAIFSGRSTFDKSGPKALSKVRDDWKVLVGSARDATQKKAWRILFENAPKNWMDPGLADANWKASPGAFGAKEGFEDLISTAWTTNDIYLRQQFAYDGKPFERGILAIHYDNATVVYLNGKVIWKSAAGAWNDAYEGIDVTKALRDAIVEGINTIAVHTHQDTGGQFIDLALLVSPTKK